MNKHLVLVGGGHAHLTTLKQLRHFTSRGHRVTLISPEAFHDYSGMGPGLISGRHRLSDARFNIARMTTIRGGQFIEASAKEIDPDNRVLQLSEGSTLQYDVISFNSGSRVTLPMPEKAVGKSIFPVKPINYLYHARQKIIATAQDSKKRLRILIIGGGPAGCEITGNLQALSCLEGIDLDIIQVTGSQLLGNYPARLRHLVRTLLASSELHCIEGVHVKTLQKHQAILDDRRIIHFDFAFVATGITPVVPFNNKRLAANNSGLIVNDFLQAPCFPEIFGGGDCISFESCQLDKVGVHAVRQNQVLRTNLLAALESKKLVKFHPQRHYLLIFNLGLGRAVATGYRLNWSGRPALWLKTYLDYNFTKKFQKVG